MYKLPESERKKLEKIENSYYAAIELLANRAVHRCFQSLSKRFPKRRFRADFYNGDSLYRVDNKYLRIYWNPAEESVVWEPGTSRGKIIPSRWSVEVDGARVNPELFEELCILEDQLLEITDGFRRGCPDSYDTAAS